MGRLSAAVLAAACLALVACGGSAAPTGGSSASSSPAQPSGSTAPSAPADKQFSFAPIGSPDPGDLHVLVAFDQMRAKGWKIDFKPIATPALVASAIANGQIDMGYLPISNLVNADNQGADLVAWLGIKGDDWSVVSQNGITSLSTLQGKRLGVSGGGGFTDAVAAYISESAHVKPQVLIIPGTSTREQSLLKGLLDASVQDLPSALDLQRKDPGKFRVLWVGAKDLPTVMAQELVSSRKWLSGRQAVAQAVAQEIIAVEDHAQQDPKWMESQAKKYFPNTDPATLNLQVQGLIDAKIWPPQGGWDQKTFQDTLGFFTKYMKLKPGSDASRYANLDIVAKARAAGSS